MPAEKVTAIQELRQEHDLKLLLEIAQLPRATFHYHTKRMVQEDKYAIIKSKIANTRGGVATGISQTSFITRISPSITRLYSG